MARKLKGLTLAELLIVIVLMTLIVGIFLGTNYFSQIKRARDVKRKEHLAKLQKIVEDFHIDHDRYPSLSEMAYALQNDVVQDWDTALAGKICGLRQTTTLIQNYIGELPCEPKSPDEDYVYFLFDNKQKYVIFTLLENLADPAIIDLGCEYGCSYFLNEDDPATTVSSNYFNYYVASSDVEVGNCYGSTAFHACYTGRRTPGERCQSCTDYTCAPGYARLYCNPNWCLEMCQ